MLLLLTFPCAAVITTSAARGRHPTTNVNMCDNKPLLFSTYGHLPNEDWPYFGVMCDYTLKYSIQYIICTKANIEMDLIELQDILYNRRKR